MTIAKIPPMGSINPSISMIHPRGVMHAKISGVFWESGKEGVARYQSIQVMGGTRFEEEEE